MLLTLLRDTLRRYARLIGVTLRPPRGAFAGRTLRHYGVGSILLILLPVLLAYHWLGLLLDELLFPGYRRVRIERPVFIMGVPRSGTTALHETLAEDTRFTTFRTWECLFALSVTWRRLWLAVAAFDRRLGKPLNRALNILERRVFSGLNAVHPTTLRSPEEDYFAFLPLLYCFILVVPFPDAEWLWRFARFDTRLEAQERDHLMAYYQRCIQRHLYVHGPTRRFLSKNASFAPLAGALAETFPDAAFLCCLREPATAVSSQLSCLAGPLRSLHGRYSSEFHVRLIEQFGFYYRCLLDSLGKLPPRRAVLIPAPALRRRLDETVVSCYARLGLAMTPAFREHLRHRARQARATHSMHHHRPADFGLDREALAAQFADVHRRFDFSRDHLSSDAPQVATTASRTRSS